MSKPTAFSYSRLTAFEECPKKFWSISIGKTVKEVETEAMLHGKAVHKSFEMRVKKNQPLPSDLRPFEGLMQKLMAAPGDKIAEQQLAINASFEPCDWFSKDTYCRAIVDLTVLNEPRAALFDYKTGKIQEDVTQMRLTGAVFLQHYKNVEKVDLAYIWLKHGKVTKPASLTRAAVPEVWSELLPRIEKYQAAFRRDDFPATPGRYCRWCPVKSCPHNAG